MAELTAFSYQPQKTAIHAIDPRLKLFQVAVLSLASLKADFLGLLLLTAVLAAVMSRLRLSLRAVFSEIRYVFLLLIFVCLARAVSTPGTPLLRYPLMAITREGLHDGLLIAWRLLLIVFLGLVLMASSRPADIRGAISRLLSPLSFIPAKRVATMVGLVVRFLPVILNQARETVEALQARGIGRRKNPIYRIKKFALPVAWRTFVGADRLIDAMQARCYSDERSERDFSFSLSDGYVLAGTVCLGLLVAFL